LPINPSSIKKIIEILPYFYAKILIYITLGGSQQLLSSVKKCKVMKEGYK